MFRATRMSWLPVYTQSASIAIVVAELPLHAERRLMAERRLQIRRHEVPDVRPQAVAERFTVHRSRAACS